MLVNVFRGGVVIRVAEDITLIVTQDQTVFVPAGDVFGQQWDFSASAGCVNHLGGHSIAGGVAAQTLDDFQPLADWCAEMRGAGNRVALIQVVGAHADL